MNLEDVLGELSSPERHVEALVLEPQNVTFEQDGCSNECR